MRFLLVAAAALIGTVQSALAQPDRTVAFHNETCGTLTLTVEQGLPILPLGSGPTDSGSSSATNCADVAGGCEVFAIDAGETRKTSPAPGASPQLVDVKIEGRCDQAPITVISGHCVLDLNEEETGDSGLVTSALDEYYYAGADPAFDITRRVGFPTGSRESSRVQAAISIALFDCDGDGVRQVCAAACRRR